MFKFTHEFDGVSVDLTVDDDSIAWPELLREFQHFLAGCGYIFSSGLDMAAVVDEAHAELIYEARNNRNSIRQEGPDLGEEYEQLF